MKLTFTFTPPIEDKIASFRKLAQTGIYESLGRLAQEAGDVMLASLQAEAPVRTGAYRDAIHQVQLAHSGGGITLEYRAPEPLSTFIIHGTAPHSIDPVSAKVLAFRGSDGALHFAHHVDHPGTKANDYVSRAVAAARGEVMDIFARTGREIIMQVAD